MCGVTQFPKELLNKLWLPTVQRFEDALFDFPAVQSMTVAGNFPCYLVPGEIRLLIHKSCYAAGGVKRRNPKGEWLMKGLVLKREESLVTSAAL